MFRTAFRLYFAVQPLEFGYGTPYNTYQHKVGSVLKLQKTVSKQGVNISYAFEIPKNKILLQIKSNIYGQHCLENDVAPNCAEAFPVSVSYFPCIYKTATWGRKRLFRDKLFTPIIDLQCFFGIYVRIFTFALGVYIFIILDSFTETLAYKTYSSILWCDFIIQVILVNRFSCILA